MNGAGYKCSSYLERGVLFLDNLHKDSCSQVNHVYYYRVNQNSVFDLCSECNVACLLVQIFKI